jgi:hypothetical protein
MFDLPRFVHIRITFKPRELLIAEGAYFNALKRGFEAAYKLQYRLVAESPIDEKLLDGNLPASRF